LIRKLTSHASQVQWTQVASRAIVAVLTELAVVAVQAAVVEVVLDVG
jgi:hypothetical protein